MLFSILLFYPLVVVMSQRGRGRGPVRPVGPLSIPTVGQHEEDFLTF